MPNPKKNIKKLKESSGPYIQPENSARSAAEFAAGSKASALVRKAFAPLIFANASRSLHILLSERLRKVIRSGPSELREKRTLAEGDLSLLKNLQLNCYTSFHIIANIRIETRINPAGILEICIEPFKLSDIVRIPPNNNSVVLRIQAVLFNFNEAVYTAIPANDLLLPLEGLDFRGGSISLPFIDADCKVLMIGAAIFFADQRPGYLSIAQDRKYTAGQILEAVYIRNGSIITFIREEKVIKRVPVKELQTGFHKWTLNNPGNAE